MKTACHAKMTPYTEHSEREKRYHLELTEIQKQYSRKEDTDSLAAQAFKNACQSEYFDATMRLTGKRIRIVYEGRVFGTDHTVARIVKLEEIRFNERACFGIVHQKEVSGETEILPIFPGTKIFILSEETVAKEAALNFC